MEAEIALAHLAQHRKHLEAALEIARRPSNEANQLDELRAELEAARTQANYLEQKRVALERDIAGLEYFLQLGEHDDSHYTPEQAKRAFLREYAENCRLRREMRTERSPQDAQQLSDAGRILGSVHYGNSIDNFANASIGWLRTLEAVFALEHVDFDALELTHEQQTRLPDGFYRIGSLQSGSVSYLGGREDVAEDEVLHGALLEEDPQDSPQDSSEGWRADADSQRYLGGRVIWTKNGLLLDLRGDTAVRYPVYLQVHGKCLARLFIRFDRGLPENAGKDSEEYQDLEAYTARLRQELRVETQRKLERSQRLTELEQELAAVREARVETELGDLIRRKEQLEAIRGPYRNGAGLTMRSAVLLRENRLLKQALQEEWPKDGRSPEVQQYDRRGFITLDRLVQLRSKDPTSALELTPVLERAVMSEVHRFQLPKPDAPGDTIKDGVYYLGYVEDEFNIYLGHPTDAPWLRGQIHRHKPADVDRERRARDTGLFEAERDIHSKETGYPGWSRIGSGLMFTVGEYVVHYPVHGQFVDGELACMIVDFRPDYDFDWYDFEDFMLPEALAQKAREMGGAETS